jgi:phosphoglycerate dehydrogenase-like enzyme
VILTPHIAGLSRESNRRVSEVTVRALHAHLAHEVA